MMTIGDMPRVLALPKDPAAPEFDDAVMKFGCDLAIAAADHRGLRAALFEAVTLMMVAMAVESGRGRATLDDLLKDTEAAALELLAATGEGRCDA